ncbi:MAG: rhodanese-like domain-containing protein [Clostridiales bacterium]|nr:rhodanese-like domain-containing protein [Eubacterium sp.]MDD5995243.1 rhodanese-like domain-containing protein [Clostridiales bacterium]MDD7350512.1 rhodanese-like domain-containing protein [Clostridiales bacterium]
MSHFAGFGHKIKEKECDTMSFSIISIQQLPMWLSREGTILIDLREREEYQKEHIKGAVNIPYVRWEEEKDGWKHQFSTLIFYCDRGNQSMYAAKEMNRLGYQAVSIAGGFESYRIWKKKGKKEYDGQRNI